MYKHTIGVGESYGNVGQDRSQKPGVRSQKKTGDRSDLWLAHPTSFTKHLLFRLLYVISLKEPPNTLSGINGLDTGAEDFDGDTDIFAAWPVVAEAVN